MTEYRLSIRYGCNFVEFSGEAEQKQEAEAEGRGRNCHGDFRPAMFAPARY